jgi:hypothetical protein
MTATPRLEPALTAPATLPGDGATGPRARIVALAPLASRARRATRLAHGRRKLAAVLALGTLAAAWVFGLALFVRADGHFELSLPRTRMPPAGRHNLAARDQGPTLRVSSYYGDWKNHHHPLFLIDGRASPDLEEKWASETHDRHPWVEVLWREPHELETVVLRHAGVVEAADLTVRHYTLTCLVAAGRGRSLRIDDNHAAIATHDLPCANARGVRVDFQPNAPNDVVRLFGFETWGR